MLAHISVLYWSWLWAIVHISITYILWSILCFLAIGFCTVTSGSKSCCAHSRSLISGNTVLSFLSLPLLLRSFKNVTFYLTFVRSVFWSYEECVDIKNYQKTTKTINLFFWKWLLKFGVEFVFVIIIYYEKTFDSVWHDWLLCKLVSVWKNP